MRYSRDFTITEKDLQSFYRMLVLQRWGKGILGFGAVGVLIGKLYMDFLSIPLKGIWAVAAMVLTGCLTMLLVTLGVMIRTGRNVRKSIRRKSYVQQTEIDGFGVHVAVDGQKAKAGFEKLHFVRETAAAFYIFMAPGEAWILPKKQMEDAAEECRKIREIFSRVIEPKRRRLLK